jgi:hypothetical protein
MKKTSLSMLLAAVSAVVFSVSGCHKPTPPASAPGASASSASTSSASDPNTPPECNAYIKRVEACIDKLAAKDPSQANTAKQMLEGISAQLSKATDKAALAQACTQASTTFDQTASQYGCN